MYLFSINATAKTSAGEFTAGENVPFIVYINFQDLFGAEQLAKIFVMREGFSDVVIDKRKHIPNTAIADSSTLQSDAQVIEALEKGYCVQAFSAH